MNPRRFEEAKDSDYYHFDPPWIPFENQNVIERTFRLKEEHENILDALEAMEELENEYSSNDIDDRTAIREGKRAIFDLIQGLEVFMYNFPSIQHEEWFGSFWQTVAAATWRAEGGNFDDDANRMISRIRDILQHNPDSVYVGVRGKIREFVEWYGRDISPSDVSEKYKNDVYEARDLYCLGYYSTALLVLGRAVEKALLELGHQRNIETLNSFGREVKWENARFYARKEALKEIKKPNSTEKMISQRQYHEISVLVDYRNNVAHSEYENLDKNEALRQIKNAFSLLREMSELITEIQELEEEEIDTIRGQTVN